VVDLEGSQSKNNDQIKVNEAATIEKGNKHQSISKSTSDDGNQNMTGDSKLVICQQSYSLANKKCSIYLVGEVWLILEWDRKQNQNDFLFEA
jgi:hypothetical protein